MSRFTAPGDGRAMFAVVGSPVAHSRSPQIHQAFARQFGIALDYARVEVGAGELAGALIEFRRAGGRGLNITVPLKEEVWALATHRTPRAEDAGAANTLWFEQGEVAVDNTDGCGLLRDLEANHGVALADRRVLLLGAGGAARGVLPAILAAAPARVMLSNRSAPRAAALRDAWAGRGRFELVPWGEAPRFHPDIVINATALSVGGEVPPLPPAAVAGAICYDLMYGRDGTVFTAWARRHGAASALDGLGMLVEQAAEAFALWHGRRPATAAVIAALRAGGG